MFKITNKETGTLPPIAIKTPDGKKTLAKFLKPGQSFVIDENRLHGPQIEKMLQRGQIEIAQVES